MYGSPSPDLKPCGTTSSYDAFIQGLNHPLGHFYGEASPVELVITSIKGDDKPVPDNEATHIFGPCRLLVYEGVEVSAAGTAHSFLNDSSASRGGSGKLPIEDFTELQLLLKTLPPDHHQVPPRGRRIIVQTEVSGVITVRVYDRAFVPQQIRELIHLTGARIEIATPVFKPVRRLTTDELERSGISPSIFLPALLKHPLATFAEDPQGKFIAVQDQWSQSLQIFELHSDKLIHEIVQPSETGSFPWTHARQFSFSPDGKLLLLCTTRPELFAYDTTTWSSVIDSPLIPSRSVIYLPNREWTEGVRVSSQGTVSLWNAQIRHEVATLDLDKRVQIASCSPDDKIVVILTGPAETRLIRASLWNTANGTQLSEIWPVEWTSALLDKPVSWWDEGHMLIAAYSSMFNHPAIGVWDIPSGVYLGTLEGCTANEAGDPFVQQDRLFLRCHSGDVWEWDLAQVKKDIEEFSGANSH